MMYILSNYTSTKPKHHSLHESSSIFETIEVSASAVNISSRARRDAVTTQLLHEQIKYCFIQIFFFIHTARVNYGDDKMCINKSEDRIVHYCVATVSKYAIGGCTYK